MKDGIEVHPVSEVAPRTAIKYQFSNKVSSGVSSTLSSKVTPSEVKYSTIP
jgi:hypothetical protein